LLDGARSTANPEERKKLYKEALTVINEEAPWLFLHSEVQMVGTRANVKGIIVHPTERVIAKEAWIE
jgi:peptide/nickel transport system substrate-binding protein